MKPVYFVRPMLGLYAVICMVNNGNENIICTRKTLTVANEYRNDLAAGKIHGFMASK